jgi:preprotein translocase subunit YajC
MNLDISTGFLGQGAPPPGQQPPWTMMVPVILIVVMMYVLMIRPQQKRAKELNALLKTLRPGDKVVSSSGIVGTVVSVKEKTVALRSAETKLEVLKSAISEITERSGESSQES